MIRTKIKNKRVYTSRWKGKWLTLISDAEPVESDSLFEAGQVHLKAAYKLKNVVDKHTIIHSL
jgi:hypothetical protein